MIAGKKENHNTAAYLPKKNIDWIKYQLMIRMSSGRIYDSYEFFQFLSHDRTWPN